MPSTPLSSTSSYGLVFAKRVDVDDHEQIKRLLEVKNLELQTQKSQKELDDLKRPYLMRNASLLTALITTIGATIGAAILVSNNYYQVIKERSALADETLRLREAETKRLEQESQSRIQEAETLRKSAEKIESKAKETVSDAQAQAANQINSFSEKAKIAQTNAENAVNDAAERVRQAEIESEKRIFQLRIDTMLRSGSLPLRSDVEELGLIGDTAEGQSKRDLVARLIPTRDVKGKFQLTYALELTQEALQIDELLRLLDGSCQKVNPNLNECLGLIATVSRGKWTSTQNQEWIVRITDVLGHNLDKRDFVDQVCLELSIFIPRPVKTGLLASYFRGGYPEMIATLRILRDHFVTGGLETNGQSAFLGSWFAPGYVAFFGASITNSNHREFLGELRSLSGELSEEFPDSFDITKWNEWLSNHRQIVDLWMEPQMTSFSQDPELFYRTMDAWKRPVLRRGP
jgi:hypothetical protein